MVLHVKVILTFIFTNSRTASVLDSQLSGGQSKLMHKASQNLRLSKSQCEFQVLVTLGGDALIASTETGYY